MGRLLFSHREFLIMRLAIWAVLCVGVLPMSAWSDEGMWLLNDPPTQRLKEKHGFELTAQWLDHARLASIRFNNGGSGSFVSANGLILTNHHIAADSVQQLSTPERDLYRTGFYAKTLADELKCPDLELNVLRDIEDVTEKVNAAVKTGMPPAEAFAARRGVIANIEKESLERTKLRSDVVTLYQGGVYHLYRYQKYTDIRLVFAPESAIGEFGGDTDNFEFPRHGFDVSFFRAYEQDKPVQPAHYLTWSKVGPKDGDLVFVTGHPGTTNRLETLAKLKHRRDVTLPYNLDRLRAQEAMLSQFGGRGPEQARQAATYLHSVANARKAFSGQYQGLLDPGIFRRKIEIDGGMIQLASSEQRDEAQKAEARIAEAQRKLRTFEIEHSLIERGDAFRSELFTIARHILRLNTELSRPNPERLREYRDSNLDSLKQTLYSPAPSYPELERTRLQQSLSFMAERLGGEHPLVVKILAGKSPAARVAELIEGTKLADVAERKRLVDGGMKAVDDSRDPMLLLARLIDREARAVRKRMEDEVEEVERQGYAVLANLRFKVLGRNVSPDATFTLRLAFGVVKGYRVDGENLPFHTTFESLFKRAEQMENRTPFALPKRWIDGKSKLDLKTPMNFVSTADTIGGNSGSPVLNREGEFIGINFDRNRHGLVRNFVYTEEQARHISVHCRAILEALTQLYDCPELVRELSGVK